MPEPIYRSILTLTVEQGRPSRVSEVEKLLKSLCHCRRAWPLWLEHLHGCTAVKSIDVVEQNELLQHSDYLVENATDVASLVIFLYLHDSYAHINAVDQDSEHKTLSNLAYRRICELLEVTLVDGHVGLYGQGTVESHTTDGVAHDCCDVEVRLKTCRQL